jgi:hypothetical protein
LSFESSTLLPKKDAQYLSSAENKPLIALFWAIRLRLENVNAAVHHDEQEGSLCSRMRRRDFMKSICAAGGAMVWAPPIDASAQASRNATQPEVAVKRVLAVFKCHLDVGFTNTQAAVVQRYFNEYFPQAIRTAAELRQLGRNRYVWTTGSWLLYEYLEQAGSEDRRRMEQAVAAGDIAWHALPFSWQTELMDQSMISGSLAFSRSLDRRFGVTTTGAKMTDVPGHTRGLIAPLASHGVTFLDIGVNSASRPAEVPALFVWKDRNGASVLVMYHHGYGNILQVPGSDLAVAIVVRDDNSGPHTPEEIAKIYSDLNQRYPTAEIIPTSLTAVANAIAAFRNNLPVVTQEIGDTWIYGISSDPLKVARCREVARLRRDWLAEQTFRVGDATDIALLRLLLLEVEHTWGTDTKRWLDYDHYKPQDLAEMLPTTKYKVVEFSWEEKRQKLFEAIEVLPAPLRDRAQAAIQNLEVTEPDSKGTPHSPAQEIETAHFILGFDPDSGAIHRLRNKGSGREWASQDHPLALFSYQALSQQDYGRFFSNYIISTADWVPKDFGKPNMEKFGAKSQTWRPSLSSLRVEETSHQHRLLAHLEIRDADALQSGRASFPRKMFVELLLPSSEPVIRLNFYWFGKPATRLPEALWLTFQPVASSPQGWTMDKTGEEVSPFDVVASGNRQMHAVGTGIRYLERQHLFAVEPLDSPLIALGEMSPLSFCQSQPDLSGGIHCSLFNNAWGTNYVQWFGEDMRFRFIVRA